MKNFNQLKPFTSSSSFTKSIDIKTRSMSIIQHGLTGKPMKPGHCKVNSLQSRENQSKDNINKTYKNLEVEITLPKTNISCKKTIEYLTHQSEDQA